MQRLKWLVSGVLVVVLLAGTVPTTGHAQGPPAPLVVFVEDQQLRTSSILDSGPDGLTQLEQVFLDLGAETRWIDPDDPYPDETRVVVLVRPLNRLSVVQLVRLWLVITRGNHLLLALDPPGTFVERGEGGITVNAENDKTSLAQLLDSVYGIKLNNAFVALPWSTNTTIADQNTMLTPAQAENVVSHPVYAPLDTYGLTLTLWNARTLNVEAFGPSSYAFPVLYTTTGYGETETRTIQNPDEFPLELNLDRDQTGRLLVAALGENTQLGSRVVVLGDSELLQNGYGLATDPLTGEPQHLADVILAQRSAAWLLELPVSAWPALPENYTWQAVDGTLTDWIDRPPLITDASEDAPIARYDIEAVSAFRDDSFLYLAVTTAEAPNPDVRVILGLETTFDGTTDMQIALTADEVALLLGEDQTAPVPDGSLAVDAALEIRLPLRIMGDGAMLSTLCLADKRTALTSPAMDCIDSPPLVIPVATTSAPESVLFPPGPRAQVMTTGTVNLRAGPGENFAVLDILPNGRVFAATGRSADSNWVAVQNARFSGWLSRALVTLNTDIENLPITEP